MLSYVITNIFSVPSRQHKVLRLVRRMLSVMVRRPAFNDMTYAIDGAQVEPLRFGANLNTSHGPRAAEHFL
jgi:hypothetical protein